MSDWYWRTALKAALLVTTSCFVAYLRADDTVQKLPFCNPHAAKDLPVFDDLVIVSTLDGRVTAFSTENGNKAWSVDTNPLLSSNLHHVELTADGRWARLVPSLRGTLYSLSGDSIEPLPFDAEQLLSSSFKYSEDLVIAGARETLWLGVDANTGKIIYECSSSGCNSEQQTASAGRDIIVLRRHSNTVRALDPRSGTEKWNFSVAEHQLALSRRECAGASGPARVVAVAVALPEGVIAVRRPDDHSPLWQQKLESPVAGMWRLHGGLLENVDVMWEAAQAIADANTQTSPSLYLGVHNSQLYIQESVLYAKKLETAISVKPVPWKLKQARPLISDGGAGAGTALLPTDESNLAIITLHGSNGKSENHGFFLYLQDTCDQSVQVNEEAFDGPDIVLPNISDDQPSHHHVHVHVYSLWFWWKEVLVIAISSAILMNLIIRPRFFISRPEPQSPLPMNEKYIVVERHYERPPSINQEYSGRYENEFTTLTCLGKGGFGVVFEAKNKIDHRSYAVKRITLPRRESKRERVLREVRALAVLEHDHIVRYFNSWLEEPPPLWQEQRDAYWMSQLGASLMSGEYTSTSHATPAKTLNKNPDKGGSVVFNLQKCDDCIDALDFQKKLSEPRRLRSRSCNDSFSIVFDEDASKDPNTSETPKNSDVTTPNRSDITTPISSKNVPSGDDDSFIVFAKPDDSGVDEAQGISIHGSGEPRHDLSNKILEKVKEYDSFKDSDSFNNKKKKKGHTRHWSLDMCVRNPEESGPKMYLYIQMQLCRRDSLHDWLRSNLTWESRKDKVVTLFSQIVSAVEYVHLTGLIHRDLKPSNIFFAPDGKVKVGDFGLATAITDNSQEGPANGHDVHARHTHRVGTYLYMSPEQIHGRPYNYKVDIYSLGLVLFELLHPFNTEFERAACLEQVKNGLYPSNFTHSYPNEVEVLKLMLSDDPKQRPTASGVKARAPLYQVTDELWHFTLPPLVTC